MSASTTAFQRVTPTSSQEWESFHFQHMLDHQRILVLVNALKGTNDKLPPPIWPFNPSNQNAYNEAHQLLHQQMDQVSGMPSGNFLNFDLKKPEQQKAFIWLNWVEHDGFRKLIGI